MSIEVTSAPEAHTIVLRGEADLLGSREIEAAFEDARDSSSECIVVDLRRLTFIDSSGLHALVSGHALCRARGQVLRVIPGPPSVQRLFEIAGMEDVLPFCDAELVHHHAPGDGATARP
jgi:anti-sigma B factor antagonist